MRIDIMTLFPDTVGDVLSESILGRAQERVARTRAVYDLAEDAAPLAGRGDLETHLARAGRGEAQRVRRPARDETEVAVRPERRRRQAGELGRTGDGHGLALQVGLLGDVVFLDRLRHGRDRQRARDYERKESAKHDVNGSAAAPANMVNRTSGATKVTPHISPANGKAVDAG